MDGPPGSRFPLNIFQAALKFKDADGLSVIARKKFSRGA